MPFFYKLWGRTTRKLNKGVCSLKIYNQFDTKLFMGEKFFVIAKKGYLGGQNYYISGAFFVSMTSSIFLIFMFNIVKTKEKEGKSVVIYT